MREKGTNSSMLRGLEIIRESFAAGRVLSPSRAGSRKRSTFDSQEDPVLERELFEICALGEEDQEEEEEMEDQENVTIEEPVEEVTNSQPISSFLPRYGENRVYARSRVVDRPSNGMEMGPGLSRVYSAPINWRPDNSILAAPGRREFSSPRVDISRKEVLDQEGLRFQRRLPNRRSISSTESVEEATEEAWERRRDRSLFLPEEETLTLASDNRVLARSVGRSVSDCGDTTWPALLQRPRSRTRSLTDEDMDELRGCIDLGFGFSNEEEDMELCNTLPALELCYAITRQYNDVTGRSSPISTSGSSSSSSLDRTSSGSSLQSSPMESWRISSPGDHPSQVKTRLRHWAQAVACTLRQSC